MKIERPVSRQPIPEHAERVFKGKIFDVYQWEQEMFDGTKKTFEKIKRLDTVIIFAVMDDEKILLIEEKQPGSEPTLGGVGGRIEDGEDVLEAAKREFLEETGLVAEKFVLWKSLQTSIKVDYALYFFIAKGVKKVAEQNLDGGEIIKFRYLTFDELLEISRTPEFMEKEVVVDLLEAYYDNNKKEEL